MKPLYPSAMPWSTNRTNSGLAPRRWRRDQAAEHELLALLDNAEESNGTGGSVPHVPRATSEAAPAAAAEQASGRAVFPMELLNR